MPNVKISYLKLCELLWENKNFKKNNADILLNHIKGEYKLENTTLEAIKKNLIKKFFTNYNKYWNKSFHKRDHFVLHHKQFLEQEFIFSTDLDNISKNTSQENEIKNKNIKIVSRGRPRLLNNNLQSRTKRRRVEEIRSCIDEELLVEAATPIINKIAEMNVSAESDSDERIDDIEKSDTSLAMYMDLQLSTGKYATLQKYNKNLSGSNVCVSSKELGKAKKRCYPENIICTQLGASIELQSLLDHTTERIFLSFHEEDFIDLKSRNINFIFKWGMDGASGQQTVKQKFIKENALSEINGKLKQDGNLNVSEESVFMVCAVPLLMKSNDKILWKNERPGSIRFCRPVRFEFKKETKDNTKNLYEYYEKKIQELVSLKIKMFGKQYNVSYSLQCTMIDGKVCNVLTDQASSNCCNICEASPVDMNDIEYVRNLSTNEKYFCFGLHPLHCRIRFLEHIWHLACRIDFQEFIVYKNSENYVVSLAKKNLMQTMLKDSLGLSIDIVKRGYGTTNDGNTSRRFFEEPAMIAKITNVDQRLIERYQIILDVLNCGLDIDVEKFKDYTLETAKLYSNLYSWYPMPPSVHKVLIHGWKIIEYFGLPMGCLSEEAQEANNKIFKKARLNNSRMYDRTMCNEDVIHHLCVSSDPKISTMRIKTEKKKKELSNEAKKLLN